MKEKILIIEDDEDIRKNLQMILESEDYEVSTAKDGRDALIQLKESQDSPSLIILDLMMPVMNGYQFREEQLKDMRLAKIPVIITTADGHIVEKSAQIGANSYIRKPFELDKLLTTVQRYARPTTLR